MYIYQTTLYKDTSRVIGADPGNSVNLTDFESTDKPIAQEINELIVSETSFVIDTDYESFEDLLVSPLSWADIKYIETENEYICYLVKE